MKLIEAFEIIRASKLSADGPVFRIYLACGFTPLHLQTFLHAHLVGLHPQGETNILTGLYGDLWGNLVRIKKEKLDAVVIALEWSDLDPRLGIRSLASWSAESIRDTQQNVKSRCEQFRAEVQSIAQDIPVAVMLPTLPFPPMPISPGQQASTLELELRNQVSNLALLLTQILNVRICSPQRLDQFSPLGMRLNVKSELMSGFPYSTAHASIVAEQLANVVLRPIPKKALITDLDDTLWKGIVGEVGSENISWDMEHQSQMHGSYQRILHSLAEAGVLIGAASKNESQIVDQALNRKDLILPRKCIFPIESHWNPKSASVDRIMKTWNIGADAVVFIDDSPMELAEVKAAYPEVECILFPKDDWKAVNDLLYRLCDLFGKESLTEEDYIRRDSIRRTMAHAGESDPPAEISTDFLKNAEAELFINCSKEPLDPRAFELVNKTNQFNLNGVRYTEASWQRYVRDPQTILMVVSYRDKYGPLGKIAVLAGRKRNEGIVLDVWVMSCRAFSRRIEHRCLEELLTRFNADQIEFGFIGTDRNGPMREFLAKALGDVPTPNCRLSSDQILKRSNESYHRVLEISNG